MKTEINITYQPKNKPLYFDDVPRGSWFIHTISIKHTIDKNPETLYLKMDKKTYYDLVNNSVVVASDSFLYTCPIVLINKLNITAEGIV